MSQNRLGRSRLIFKYIECCPGHMSAVKCIEQSRFINYSTASCIYKQNTFFHFSDFGTFNYCASIRLFWNMNRNGVAAANKFIKLNFLNIYLHFSVSVNDKRNFGINIINISANNPHSTAERILGNSLTYTSKSNDTKGFA